MIITWSPPLRIGKRSEQRRKVARKAIPEAADARSTPFRKIDEESECEDRHDEYREAGECNAFGARLRRRDRREIRHLHDTGTPSNCLGFTKIRPD